MAKPIKIICSCGWADAEPGNEDEYLEAWHAHRMVEHPGGTPHARLVLEFED